MKNVISKRFVIRQSLVGKNVVIEFTNKKGVKHVYNHDIAFNIMKSKLENESVEFTHRKVPGFPLEQLFINDPDGVKVELNYKVDE